MVYPYSSYSLNVYAVDDNPVTVTATAGDRHRHHHLQRPGRHGGLRRQRLLHLCPEHGQHRVGLGAERIGASRSARSRSTPSGSARSGSARSYPVPEDPVPGETVYDVIDYTYVVTPDSQDDAGTYLSLFNIDPAYEGSYVFQVSSPSR